MNMNGMNQSMMNPYSPVYNPMRSNIGQNVGTNEITWVQGIEGAKAFQLMPNSNAILMDSENDRMYIKTCDNVGMCSLRIFKYEEMTDNSNKGTQDLSNYVTKEELNEAINNIVKGKSNGKQSISTDEPKSTK